MVGYLVTNQQKKYRSITVLMVYSAIAGPGSKLHVVHYIDVQCKNHFIIIFLNSDTSYPALDHRGALRSL